MSRTQIDASLLASDIPTSKVQGTTTNDNAPTGGIGEYVEVVYSATNAPAAGAFGDATSISLTAGDWDVSHQAVLLLSGATLSGNVEVGVSTTSGNTSPSNNGSDVQFLAWSTASNSVGGGIFNRRFSLASTTTVYAKIRAVTSAGTPQFTGRISARRIR